MKILDFFIPAFLKRIDRFLLLHYPVVWETRVHYVTFYSLLVVNSLAFAVGWLLPIHEASMPNFAEMRVVLVLSILSSLLVLGFYAYQQSSKRRLVYRFSEIITRALIYTFCTLSILANAFVLPSIIRHRVQTLFEAEQLSEDLKTLKRAEYTADLIDYVLRSGKAISSDEGQQVAFLDQLRASHLNQQGQINQHLQVLKALEEILPPFSTEKQHDYNVKRKELLDNISKQDLLFDQIKHLKLGHFSSDSTRAARLLAYFSWAPEFKARLQQRLELTEIGLHAGKLWKKAPLFLNSAALQALHQQYRTPFKDGQQHFSDLMDKIQDIHCYHQSSLPFFNADEYRIYNYQGENTLQDMLRHCPQSAHSYEDDAPLDTYSYEYDLSLLANGASLDILLDPYLLEREVSDYTTQVFTADYHWQAFLILVMMMVSVILSAQVFTLRNVFTAVFVGMAGMIGFMILFFAPITEGVRESLMLPNLDWPFPSLFFAGLTVLLSVPLTLVAWTVQTNHPWLRWGINFLLVCSFACSFNAFFLLLSTPEIFDSTWQLYEERQFCSGKSYYSILLNNLVFYFYAALFVSNVLIYNLYNHLMSWPRHK